MPQASDDLWNIVSTCRQIILKNNKNVFLLVVTVVFLKELVLELIERPSYMHAPVLTASFHLTI